MSEKKTLEVGDELAAFQYSNYTGRIEKITRVTKTSAFADRAGFREGQIITTRFKREIESRFARIVGGGSFGPAYEIVTDEIREKIYIKSEQTELSTLVSKINIPEISAEDRKALIEILSKYKKP